MLRTVASRRQRLGLSHQPLHFRLPRMVRPVVRVIGVAQVRHPRAAVPRLHRGQQPPVPVHHVTGRGRLGLPRAVTLHRLRVPLAPPRQTAHGARCFPGPRPLRPRGPVNAGNASVASATAGRLPVAASAGCTLAVYAGSGSSSCATTGSSSAPYQPNAGPPPGPYAGSTPLGKLGIPGSLRRQSAAAIVVVVVPTGRCTTTDARTSAPSTASSRARRRHHRLGSSRTTVAFTYWVPPSPAAMAISARPRSPSVVTYSSLPCGATNTSCPSWAPIAPPPWWWSMAASAPGGLPTATTWPACGPLGRTVPRAPGPPAAGGQGCHTPGYRTPRAGSRRGGTRYTAPTPTRTLLAFPPAPSPAPRRPPGHRAPPGTAASSPAHLLQPRRPHQGRDAALRVGQVIHRPQVNPPRVPHVIRRAQGRGEQVTPARLAAQRDVPAGLAALAGQHHVRRGSGLPLLRWYA